MHVHIRAYGNTYAFTYTLVHAYCVMQRRLAWAPREADTHLSRTVPTRGREREREMYTYIYIHIYICIYKDLARKFSTIQRLERFGRLNGRLWTNSI